VTDRRLVQVVGIGAGDPEHLTLEAAAAIARTDVFLAVDKGEVTADLAALRETVLARHARPGHRVVTVADPPRDRDASAYTEAVTDWQARRGALYAYMIAAVPPGAVGSFLVWGDPAVYDGTLPILAGLALPGVEVRSVPGISAVSALASAHRIVLHRVGRPFTVTTGRRLAADGLTGDDVVVMLDARCAFTGLDPSGIDVYWGAYLGTPDEILVAGDLAAVREEIVAVRAAARERKGWIMDTYLLRRRDVG
jgi:precorrin-6A synthase